MTIPDRLFCGVFLFLLWKQECCVFECFCVLYFRPGERSEFPGGEFLEAPPYISFPVEVTRPSLNTDPEEWRHLQTQVAPYIAVESFCISFSVQV